MYVGRDWDPLDVGEGDIFTLDFVRDLAAGETIASASFSAVALLGVDPAPNSRLMGRAAFFGTKVSQMFTGALAGEKYRLIATVATNLRPAVKLWSHFPCQDPTVPS